MSRLFGKVLLIGNSDNLILDAPDFKEPWEKSFENWKNYVSMKE